MATELYGRDRLQAALNKVTQELPARAVGREAAQPTKAKPGSPEVWYGMFQTEGWAAFKSWLEARREGYLTKLQNPTATLDEIRIAQGAVFEINFILAEEGRIKSLVNKTPPPLPVDISSVQEGRAP